MSTNNTGFEIKTAFFPLAWFLYFCSPKIEINGQVHKKYWGKHFYSVEPGEHEIKIYFKYFSNETCGLNMINISINQGDKINIKYYMPPWAFAKGSIKIK